MTSEVAHVFNFMHDHVHNSSLTNHKVNPLKFKNTYLYGTWKVRHLN